MRKLATIQTIEEIKPIEGADKIEAARIKGWWVVVKKEEFKVGDPCVFFEIDSLVPVKPAFSFLEKNGTKTISVMGELNQPNFEVTGYRIKTIKLRKQISQGLALPLSSFPEIMTNRVDEDVSELLGVYKYEHCVGASLAGDAKCSFPSYVPKTDEERIQNCYGDVVADFINHYFTLTEKIDGTSLTVIHKDDKIHVCSRNLSLKETETNTYWNMAKRYQLQERLPNNFAIQGEIAGEGIQKNRLALVGRDLYVFYVYDIVKGLYLPFPEMESFCNDLGLKTVPLIDKEWLLTPAVTRDDIIKYADGVSLLNPKAIREGVVWRVNDPKHHKFSFKAISNEYLLKWGE